MNETYTVSRMRRVVKKEQCAVRMRGNRICRRLRALRTQLHAHKPAGNMYPVGTAVDTCGRRAGSFVRHFVALCAVYRPVSAVTTSS